ncbi:unnamed protein product [Paramecium sonneborni]|uniref:U-box domain-containing protein n=1 Tax=Paramecium sonneborni TaxID=65129 RepID=A0A8S1P6S8_9CILI|nr:unnamed protein product [Paramecium sonneborni]
MKKSNQQGQVDKNSNNNAWLYALGGLAIGAIATFFGMKTINDNNQSQIQSQVQTNQQAQQVTSDGEQFIETLCCPITGELINDAAQLSTCGHTFERQALLQWLNKSKDCPSCRKPANQQNIIKNYALQEIIDQHRSKK